MRDVQRLRQLTSATATGLWAEDALLALDRVTRLGGKAAKDIGVLEGAATVLDAALGRSENPLAAPDMANALIATNTALDVAEDMSENRSPERTQAMLRQVAAILRAAVAGELGGETPERIAPAVGFFSAIGRQQLAAGNSASGHNGGLQAWRALAPTSSFS